jgi:hypothetical protein
LLINRFEAADDDLFVDDVAVLEVALVFAIGGEEVPQRRAIAALGLLPLGGRVLTTGDLPSEITGGLAGGVERDRGPRPDADHTVLAGATAGGTILEPERPRAAGQNPHGETSDGLVPDHGLADGRHARAAHGGFG